MENNTKNAKDVKEELLKTADAAVEGVVSFAKVLFGSAKKEFNKTKESFNEDKDVFVEEIKNRTKEFVEMGIEIFGEFLENLDYSEQIHEKKQKNIVKLYFVKEISYLPSITNIRYLEKNELSTKNGFIFHFTKDINKAMLFECKSVAASALRGVTYSTLGPWGLATDVSYEIGCIEKTKNA